MELSNLISKNVEGNLTVIADQSICIHALFTLESISHMQTEDSQVEWNSNSVVIVIKNFRFDIAPPTTAGGGPNVLLVVNDCSVSALEKGFKLKQTSLNWTSIPAVCEKVQQHWSSIRPGSAACINNTTFNCSLSFGLTQLVNEMSKSPMVASHVSACAPRCEQHVSPVSSALCTSLCRCVVSDTRSSPRRTSRDHVFISADQRLLLDCIPDWTTGYNPPPSDGSGSTACSVALGSQPMNADEINTVAPESPSLRLSCDIDHSPAALSGENVLENLAQEQTQSNSESEFYVTVDERDANFQSQQDDIDMLQRHLGIDDIVEYDDHNYSNAAVHCDDVIEHLFAVRIQQQQELTSNQQLLQNAQGVYLVQPNQMFASPPLSNAHVAVPPSTVFQSPFPFHSTQVSQNAPAMPIDLGFSPVLPGTQHSRPVGSENQLSDSLEIPSAVVEYARNLFFGSHSSSAPDMTVQRQLSGSVDQQSLPAKVHNSVATAVTNAKVKNIETSSGTSGPSATVGRESDIHAASSGSDVNVLRSSYVDSGPAAEVLAISSTSMGSSTIPCSHRTDSNDVEMRDLAADAVPECHTAAAAAAAAAAVADADDILCTTNNFLHITNVRSLQPDSESFMMWQGASQLPPTAGKAPVVTSASPMSSDLTSPLSRSIHNRDLLHNYTQVVKRTDSRQSVNGSESPSLEAFRSPNSSVCDTDSVKASAKSRRGRTESSPGEPLSNPEVLFRKVRLPRGRERGKRKLYNTQMLMDIEESQEGSGLAVEKAAVDRDVDQTIQNMSLALECVNVTEDHEVVAGIIPQTGSAHDQVKSADGGAGVSEKRRGRRRSLRTDETTENDVTADLSPTTRERKSPTVEGTMQRGLSRRGRGRGRGTKGSRSVDGENDVAGCTSNSLHPPSVMRSDESIPASGEYAKRRGLRTRQASTPADAQEVEMLRDVGISSDIEKPLPAEKSSEVKTHSKNECSVIGHSSTKMFAAVTNCGVKLSPINVASVGVNDASDAEQCNMKVQIVLQPCNAHPVMTLPDIEPDPCPQPQTSAVVAGRNLQKLSVDLEEAELGKSAAVAAPNVAQMQSVCAASPMIRERANIFELLKPGSEETDGNLTNTGSSSTCLPNTNEAAVTAKKSPSTSVCQESVLKRSCVTLKPLTSFNATSVAGASVARSGVASTGTGSLCESLPCAQRSSSRTSCSNTAGSVFRLSADTPLLLPFVTERKPRVGSVRGVTDSPDAVPVASQNSNAGLVPRLALDETDVSNNSAESLSKSVNQPVPPCPTVSTHSKQKLPPNQTLPEFPPSNSSSNHLTQKTSNSLRSSGPDRLTYPTPNTTTSVLQTSSVGSRSSLSDCASGMCHQKETLRSKPSQQSSSESSTSRLTLPTPKNSLTSHQPPPVGLTNLESTTSCQLNYAKIQERLGLTQLTALQQNRYSLQVPKDVEVYAFDCFKKL